MYCKELTFQQLWDWGFHTPPTYDPVSDKWTVKRFWRSSNPHSKFVYKELTVTKAIGKHKYTQDKVYLKVTFSADGKTYSIPLSRFIFAYFNGIAHEGLDIEHIDNNPFNNNIFNLRECTRQENLAKRFTDNPDNNINQWAAIKKKD